MKKLILFFVAGAVFASCKDKSSATSGDAQQAAKAGEGAINYTVDASKSSLKWKANKQKQTEHSGTVAIKTGTLSFENGTLKAGNFVIDMKSISVGTDPNLPQDKIGGFIGHISSKDFFDVEANPESKFEITKTQKTEGKENEYTVWGNLTIKGVTKEISFPATITADGTNSTANATFTINRNDWGIVWGGEKDQNIVDFMKDNMIVADIHFDVALSAAK